ncbi:MAG: flagellar biosynthetic protein FliR [Myxococcaceae bacterium]
MNLQAAISAIGDELGFRVSFTVVLLTFSLLMSRLLPIILFSPFLGGEVVPSEVKLGIGVTLGIVLFPGLVDRLQYIPTGAIPFLFLMCKELFIGLCLSFVVGMIFEAAQIAGTLIDAMAGTNMAQVQVPQLNQQVSLFSSLKLQLSVVLFLTLNGHHMVIQAFADSLEVIPLDTFPRFSSGVWPFFDLLIRVFADMMRIALAISAPIFITAFLTDLALGMINRVAPQVQVFFVSMQIKPMLTVLMMFTVIHLILARVTVEFGGMFRLVGEVVRLLG